MAEKTDQAEFTTRENSTNFKSWLGITELEKHPGEYSAQLLIKPFHKNSLGWIHGGVYMSLLDTVMGNAVLALKEEYEWKWGATSSLSVQFQRPARGERIIGNGEVTKVGRHLVYVEGTIRDEDNTLLCRAVGTWFVGTKPEPK